MRGCRWHMLMLSPNVLFERQAQAQAQSQSQSRRPSRTMLSRRPTSLSSAAPQSYQANDSNFQQPNKETGQHSISLSVRASIPRPRIMIIHVLFVSFSSLVMSTPSLTSTRPHFQVPTAPCPKSHETSIRATATATATATAAPSDRASDSRNQELHLW